MAEGGIMRTRSKDNLTPAAPAVPTTAEELEIVRAVSSNKGGDQEDYSLMPIETVRAKFDSKLDGGLTSQQAEERLLKEGLNELYKPPKPTLLMLFLMQMTGFIIILLMLAAVGSIFVNATSTASGDPLSYTTGVAIFLIVLINAGIAAWAEHQAGGALDALAKMSQAEVSCIRDGKEQMVATNSLVRGDIVLIGTGDVVPADILLFVA
jgi:magnesium-transporting ATPase (P-type)